MGSKLAVLATQLMLIAGLTRGAAADSASKARDLFKQGVEEYKAKSYDAAAATLKASYELDPRPDALFALAQAERLGGRCPEAITHYKKLLEATNDIATAKAVTSNLALCPEPVVDKPAPSKESEAAPAPAPIIQTRTVIREVGHTDKLATVLFSGGLLGLGAAGGLFIASNGSHDDADHARTLDDHEQLLDRASSLRVASYVAAGTGVALVSVAVIRWARGGKASKTEVAVAPAASGTMMFVSSRW